MAAIAAEEALPLFRAGARLAMSRAARRTAMRGAARFFGRAYRTGSRFVKKNPFTAGTLAGYGLEKIKIKKKRKLSRPAPGPVKRPKTVIHPGARLIPYGGSKFRKLKRPKRESKFLKFKKDTSVQVNDDNCVWVGLQGNGGFDDFTECATAALLRAIFAVCKWHPNSMDSPVYLPMSADTDSIDVIMSYRGVRGTDGDVSYDTDTHTFTQGDTFQSIVTAYAANIRTKLSSGLLPDVVTVKNTTKNQVIARQIDVGQSFIEIHVTTIAHIQNQTLAASTGGAGSDQANALNIHSQPLSGKMYYFENATPVVKPEVNVDPSVFQDQIVPHGVWTQSSGASPFNDNDRLMHPPHARSVFDNCKATTNITFAPGEVKKQKLVLSFKGTISKLFDKLMRRNGNFPMTQHTWGKQIVLCVERTVRHHTQSLELALNVERHLSAYVRVKHHRAGLTKYDDVQL
jgi:hypothetical protein